MSKHITHYKKFYEWYDEDLWGHFAIAKRNSKALQYLYEAFQANPKKRLKGRQSLYKGKKTKFLRVYKKKRQKFLYQVNATDKEFKRKKRRFRGKKTLIAWKLQAFYGNIRLRSLRRLLHLKSKNAQIWTSARPFLLESRLDILLYRTNLFHTIFFAKQFIRHKGVLVNGLLLFSPNFQVQVGDIVTIPRPYYREFFYKFLEKLKTRRVLRNLPPYLEMNYRIGSFMILRLPRAGEIAYPFKAKAQTNWFYK